MSNPFNLIFSEIFDSINKSKNYPLTPNLNPTEIYNEGWMVRFLVSYSKKCHIVLKDSSGLELVDFGKINNWTSEGLISSPFLKVKKNRESHTHADVALGDFRINYIERGEIKLDNDAKIFGIIEAKMGSNLSPGTTYAKNYNQASRNLACIASNIPDKCKSFFLVAAPEEKIKHHKIYATVDKGSMIKQIEDRYVLSGLSKDMNVTSKANDATVGVVSFESWIEHFQSQEKNFLLEFYENCKFWNRIR